MTKKYRLEITNAAKRQLKKLPRDIQRLIINEYGILQIDPRHNGTKKLIGWDYNQYRTRVGKYRIIYTIEDNIILVTVIKVGHRKEVYN